MTKDANDQTIFRVACRDRPFTMIGNGVLQSWELPLEVRGFLACILSLPPDWSFRAGWFFRKNSCGKDRGYRILKQLIAANYAQRSANRRPDGTISGYAYVFTDIPGDFGHQPHQLPVFQEVDGWPIKRAPERPAHQLPGYPDAGQPDAGQPDPANGSLQKKKLHKKLTATKKASGTKKSSVRSRADRPTQLPLKNQDDEPMALTPSPDALARGLSIAAGWDKAWLLEKFREMNDEVEVRNVDAAWLGFCRYQGPNPDKPVFKPTGKGPAIEEAPAGLVPIVRLGAEWQSWIDHLDKHDRPIADVMRSSRTFMAYVPASLPRHPADRPTFPRVKAKA